MADANLHQFPCVNHRKLIDHEELCLNYHESVLLSLAEAEDIVSKLIIQDLSCSEKFRDLRNAISNANVAVHLMLDIQQQRFRRVIRSK